MVSFFIQHSFVFCNRLLTHIVFIELSEFPVREHLASTLFVSWSLLSLFFVFFSLDYGDFIFLSQLLSLLLLLNL